MAPSARVIFCRWKCQNTRQPLVHPHHGETPSWHGSGIVSGMVRFIKVVSTFIIFVCGVRCIADCPFVSHEVQREVARSYLARFAKLDSVDPSVGYDDQTPEEKAFHLNRAHRNNEKAARASSRDLWFKIASQERERLLSNPGLVALKNAGYMHLNPATGDGCDDTICTSTDMVVHIEPRFARRWQKRLAADFRAYIAFVLGHEIGHVVLEQVTYAELPKHDFKTFIATENKQDPDEVEMIADGIASELTGIAFDESVRLMKLDGEGDGDFASRLGCYESFLKTNF